MADNRYKNGKIYRLVNSVDDEIYVGSTCTSLAKRMYRHKQAAKLEPDRPIYKHLNQIGWDNIRIILIEEYPCENKMQLERKEREHIEALQPTLNSCIPTRTDQEYRKANKEILREKRLVWEEKHKETTREYMANYYEKNKEALKQKAKYHNDKNREKRLEQWKNMSQEDRDRLNAKRRERYALKKQQAQQNS